jgi:hypothetical protein
MGGGLSVHSPKAADDKTRRAVDELGSRAVYRRAEPAPSNVGYEWAAAYREADVWCAPKLLHKSKDVALTGALPLGWGFSTSQTSMATSP